MPAIEEWLKKHGFCLAKKVRRHHIDSPHGKHLVSETYVAWKREGDYVIGIDVELWWRGQKIVSCPFSATRISLETLKVLRNGTIISAEYMSFKDVRDRVSPQKPASLKAVLDFIAKALKEGTWLADVIMEPEGWLTIAASPCIYTPCVDLVLAILLKL